MDHPAVRICVARGNDLRVLIDHIASEPNAVTGIATYTWCIAAALGQQPGHQIFLHTNWNLSRVPDGIRDTMSEIVPCDNPRNETLAIFSRASKVLELERRFDIDVVFSPQPLVFLRGEAARVLTVHDLYRKTHPELHRVAQRMQWAALFPTSLRFADAAICVSHATRDTLLRFYPSAINKTFVVQEAPPLSPPHALIKRAQAQDYALMVGNIQPSKNVGAFCNAILALKNQGSPLRFIHVGEDGTGEINAFIAQHPNAGLQWLRNASQNELIKLYSKACCYVNTSLTEGFCLPVLEAQSFGVPVICSDLPVLREVAGSGALFFNPKNPAELVSHISRLWADSGLAASLSDAALTNASRFSWERAAQETFKVFDRAIVARQRRQAFL